LNDFVKETKISLDVIDSRRKLEFGAIWTLLCCSRSHRTLPVTYLEEVIEPAIRAKQSAIFQNSQNEVIGFAVWAKISSETFDRIANSGNFTLHHSEWNEGEIIWLVDLVVLPNYAKSVLTLRNLALIENPTEIIYTRRRLNSISLRSINSHGIQRLLRAFSKGLD
jgi:hemolysin-activating ACP:hemolysin acyltransferase